MCSVIRTQRKPDFGRRAPGDFVPESLVSAGLRAASATALACGAHGLEQP